MRRATISTTIMITMILLMLIINPRSSTAFVEQNNEPVKVVVSIEMLKTIVSPLLRGIGEVYSILPGETEPHSFTLTLSAINYASNSDLLIVTGHMVWEEKLIEEVARIKGASADSISINLLRLNNIKILSLSGEKNYHGFWLLPENALIIAGEIREKILRIKPALSPKITENYKEFERKVHELEGFLSFLSGKYGICGRNAIIGFYAEQYVAEAIGLKVSLALIGEEGVVRPEALRKIHEKPSDCACIIVSEVAVLMGDVRKTLEEISERSGCPIAYILTVSSYGLDEYDAVMYYNVGQICSALLTRRPPASVTGLNIYLIVIIALLIAVALEALFLFRGRLAF